MYCPIVFLNTCRTSQLMKAQQPSVGTNASYTSLQSETTKLALLVLKTINIKTFTRQRNDN